MYALSTFSNESLHIMNHIAQWKCVIKHLLGANRNKQLSFKLNIRQKNIIEEWAHQYQKMPIS
jgi:hypothetical protein